MGELVSAAVEIGFPDLTEIYRDFSDSGAESWAPMR